MVVRTLASSSTSKIGSFITGVRSYCTSQDQGEFRAFARLRLYLDGPAVLVDDLLHNGKSNAGTHFTRLLRFLRAVELFEDTPDLFFVHSDTLILNGKLDMIRSGTVSIVSVNPAINGHARLGWGIFDGVRQQIIDCIL